MTARVALFGKLPAHGDFVRRGDPALVARLDEWLTAQVERLAADYGDAYDICFAALPRWSFTLPDGLAGALGASHDRVGRVFPVAACTAGGRSAAEAVGALLGEADRSLLDAGAVGERLLALADGAADEPRWWRPAAGGTTLAIAGLPAGADFRRLLDEPA